MTEEIKTDNLNDSKCNDLLSVTVYNGKYTVVQDHKGVLRALRYGEEWRDCCGDGLILALAKEVDELRKLVKLARDIYIDENDDGETDCVTPFDVYR
jgi:hypothetical protein